MKENYDKVILGVGAVALLVALAFVFLKGKGVEEELAHDTPAPSSRPIDNNAEETESVTRVFVDATVPVEGTGLLIPGRKNFTVYALIDIVHFKSEEKKDADGNAATAAQ